MNLTKGEIRRILRKTGKIFPEHLFEEPNMKDGVVTLIYSYNGNGKSNGRISKKIVIDLNKYSR